MSKMHNTVSSTKSRIAAAGLGDRLRAVQLDLTTDRLDGCYDVVWSSLALHHVHDLDGLLRWQYLVRCGESPGAA